MASTSGQITGNRVNFTNSSNGVYIQLNWQLASQNQGGDYSTINWQCYLIFYGGAYSEMVNGHVNTNVGAVYNNGGVVSNHASGNFLMGSGSFNVGHDGAGNGTLQMNASCDIYGGGTTAAGTTTWSLPQIARYANITSFNQQATDEGISFEWTSDNNVDYISWWSNAYDGGGHHDTPAGGGGPFEIDLHNLRSETTYDITVAIRRADSGLWTNSGTAYPTTSKQSNFIGMRVP